MSLTINECVSQIRKEYPGFFPYAYVEFNGAYVFNLIPNGEDPETAIADFHIMDPNTGEISGNVPTLKMLGNEQFRNKWMHANLVKDTGEAKHSFFQGYGESVRKNADSYISHYGIKGQKWGVRRFQNEDGTWTEAGKERYGKGSSEKRNDVRGNGEIATAAVMTVSKLAAVSAIFGVATLVQNARMKSYQKDQTQKSRVLSDNYLSDISEHKDFSDSNPPKMIQGSHTADEDMTAVNPKYNDKAVPGTHSNCVLCSITYDLRRRGYNVTSKLSANGNSTKLLMKEVYDKPKMESLRATNFDAVFNKALKKFPEGSRGLFGVNGYYGGGHEMAFEVKNGKFIVRCAQSNQTVSASKLARYGFNPLSADAVRVDHLNVRMENVSKVCNELKSDWKQTIANQSKTKSSSAKSSTSTAKAPSKTRKTMTALEKQKSLEKQWKKQHPGVTMDSEAREAMKNWVEGNMWSFPEDGETLIHDSWKRKDVYYMNTQTNQTNAMPSYSLAHYGIRGQKWGIRRFQEENGTYTAAGRERYGKSSGSKDSSDYKKYGRHAKAIRDLDNIINSKDPKIRKLYTDKDMNSLKDYRNKLASLHDKSKRTGLNRKGEPVQYQSESSKWKAKDASNLSDDELNRRNSRLQREQQYKMMTTPQWKKDASALIKDAGKKILIATAVGLAAKYMKDNYSKVTSTIAAHGKRKVASIMAANMLRVETMTDRSHRR